MPCSTDFPRHSSSFNPSEGQGDHKEKRDYSLEELKELLNKLMLMSGTKEHSNAEVARGIFEVRIYIYVGASVLIPSVWAEHSHC